MTHSLPLSLSSSPSPSPLPPSRIRALDAEWMDLPYIERTALLEFDLRKHQFLFKYAVFSLVHNDVEYSFKVTDIQPEGVVSITDTDLQTDILEPEPVMGNEPLVLSSEGEATEISIPSGSSIYFSFPIQNTLAKYTVDVSAIQGDPDVYIASDIKEPGPHHFLYCHQGVGGGYVSVEPSSDGLSEGTVYGCIRAYPSGGDAVARLKLKVNDPSIENASSSPASPSSSSTSPSASASTTPAATDKPKCKNCGKHVSKSAMAMHEIQCARLMTHCDICKTVVRKGEIEKHKDLVHGVYTCQCHASGDQETIRAHRLFECRLRLVDCIYCPLRIFLRDRGEHQYECGTRLGVCKECGASYKRKGKYM